MKEYVGVEGKLLAYVPRSTRRAHRMKEYVGVEGSSNSLDSATRPEGSQDERVRGG